MENIPTIVTMIYDIRKREIKDKRNRTALEYIDLATKFILKLPYPIVIFLEDEEIGKEIFKFRESLGLGLQLQFKTQIMNIKFEETYYFQYINKVNDLQKTFKIYNSELNHETPAYITLTNNKFFFMEQAIQLDPFESSRFIWLDFGINHVADDLDRIHEWILQVPDKIKQLCINPLTENNAFKEIFQNIYHHTAGGLFSGSKENILLYSELFRKKTVQIYNEEWYQLEEAVMTMIQKENPELFEFYYGDYKGIVSNYLTPVNNIDLILRGSQKYLDSGNTREAFNVLMYCLPFFEKNFYSNYIYTYLQQHIVADYYCNEGRILPSVIYLINRKILEKEKEKERENNNDDIIHIQHLLTNNHQNLQYYKNRTQILSYL